VFSAHLFLFFPLAAKDENGWESVKEPAIHRDRDQEAVEKGPR
jgi:hypothetical protein